MYSQSVALPIRRTTVERPVFRRRRRATSGTPDNHRAIPLRTKHVAVFAFIVTHAGLRLLRSGRSKIQPASTTRPTAATLRPAPRLNRCARDTMSGDEHAASAIIHSNLGGGREYTRPPASDCLAHAT